MNNPTEKTILGIGSGIKAAALSRSSDRPVLVEKSKVLYRNRGINLDNEIPLKFNVKRIFSPYLIPSRKDAFRLSDS